MATTAPRDDNRVPGLIGESNAADRAPVTIYADPSTHRLLVNATLTGVSSGDGAILDGVDTGIRATVFDYTNSNPLGVVLRDTNGDYVSVGGGTQYTEDAAAVANPVGTAVNLIRKDTPAGEVTTDGDNIAQRGTNYGAAYVTLLDTSGSAVSVGGGTQYDEDTASADAQKLTMAGVTRADTAASQVGTDGDRSTLIVDASGRMHVNVGASALPTGAATAAKQDTGNTSLASIDGKITAVNTGAVVVSSSALPSGASTLAEQQTQTASLSVLDDWDESDRAKVNIIAGQVGVDGNSGNKSALTQRVVLATDQPQLTNALKVDGSAVTQPVSIAATVSENLAQVAGGTVSTTGVTGQQKVGIVDSLGNSTSSTPYARLAVELNPHQIFYDPFDSTLDATDRWTTPTVGNSAVTASNTAGVMSMGTGTTASGWSKLTSQASFTPTVPGWIGYSFLILNPDLAAPTANSYRFWGAGTIATVPTTAAPMTDAVGFEISTAGKMFAVIYTAGTRTAVQDLSAATGNSTQPTDALLHRYIVKIRTDRVYFYIDGETSAQLVATFSATTSASGPSVQTLPISFVAVGGATPPVSNSQIQSLGAVVWDASQNNNTLSDGQYQWRKATVKKASTAAATTDTALVVAPHPSSVAFGTGTRSAITQRVTIATDDSVPVTIASVPSHAVTNAGVFAVQVDGAALTALQLIDDPVATLGTTTYTEASTKGNVIGAVRRDANTTLVDTTNEIAPLQVNATGELKVAQIQALPAGSNAIGKLAANDGVDIGDVTVNNASGASAVNVQDGGNSITVDYATTGSGTATGALRVELPTNGTGVVATVTSLTQMNGAAIAMGTGTRSAGTQRVTIATDDIVPASQSGTWTVQPGNTANTTPWLVTQTPKTSGGLTTYHLVSAATTNATVIKASAGQVFGWFIYNSNAAARKLVFHNTASAPTAGASVFFSVVIPPSAGANVEFTNGVAFSSGIAITTVTGLADSDSAAVALNDLIINVFYS